MNNGVRTGVIFFALLPPCATRAHAASHICSQVPIYKISNSNYKI